MMTRSQNLVLHKTCFHKAYISFESVRERFGIVSKDQLWAMPRKRADSLCESDSVDKLWDCVRDLPVELRMGTRAPSTLRLLLVPVPKYYNAQTRPVNSCGHNHMFISDASDSNDDNNAHSRIMLLLFPPFWDQRHERILQQKREVCEDWQEDLEVRIWQAVDERFETHVLETADQSTVICDRTANHPTICWVNVRCSQRSKQSNTR
eukprot:1373770-Amphidinium_carterae.2